MARMIPQPQTILGNCVLSKVDIRGRVLALVFAAPMWFSPLAALAQSAAEPTLPGFLSTTGCHPGQLVCWQPYSSTSPLPSTDANNASFSAPTQITVGGTALSTPVRDLDAECTAAGTATVTFTNGQSVVWQVSVGSQNQPWQATGVSATTGTCTFYGFTK